MAQVLRLELKDRGTGGGEVEAARSARDWGSTKMFGVADGARTHDNRNHNPGLYQLSYSHHRRAKYNGAELISEPRLMRHLRQQPPRQLQV
jgi:hypothetical protein